MHASLPRMLESRSHSRACLSLSCLLTFYTAVIEAIDPTSVAEELRAQAGRGPPRATPPLPLPQQFGRSRVYYTAGDTPMRAATWSPTAGTGTPVSRGLPGAWHVTRPASARSRVEVVPAMLLDVETPPRRLAHVLARLQRY